MKKIQEKQSFASASRRKIIRIIFPLFRKNYTYISMQMEIRGDIVADQNLVIDGKMSGNIRSSKHVSLGEASHFEGSISCQSASVSGYVKGCVRASKSLNVKTPATIDGDLISASIHIEPGVILRGKIFSDPQELQTQAPVRQWISSEAAPAAGHKSEEQAGSPEVSTEN